MAFSTGFKAMDQSVELTKSIKWVSPEIFLHVDSRIQKLCSRGAFTVSSV